MQRKQWLNEDWTAVFVAFLIIVINLGGFHPSLPALNWRGTDGLITIFAPDLFLTLTILWGFGLAMVTLGFITKGDAVSLRMMGGYTLIFSIAVAAQLITGNREIKALGLEIVLFSLFIGLFISNLLKVPEWVRPVIQTELYIKIGLVLLGTGIIFQEMMQAGALGLIQSIVVVVVVWQVSFWICRKFGLDDELRAMLSSAVAICGVSAAIATAGAIKGDSKKLSYVISLVLITAIPMMLIMPYIARSTGMSDAVAGAWLGGTIDTTGAVVAAGHVLGEEALKYATVVKFSQNVLLGLAAFAISVYWAYTRNEKQERPSARTIWDRFPKFVLGFIVASFVFSFLLSPHLVAGVKSPLKGLQTFWFALAFTCIGLETKFNDIFSLENGRPAIAFLIAQSFNILFTLIVALFVFG